MQFFYAHVDIYCHIKEQKNNDNFGFILSLSYNYFNKQIILNHSPAATRVDLAIWSIVFYLVDYAGKGEYSVADSA